MADADVGELILNADITISPATYMADSGVTDNLVRVTAAGLDAQTGEERTVTLLMLPGDAAAFAEVTSDIVGQMLEKMLG